MNDQPIVIDTPDGMAHLAMLQVIGALSIEVRTGMSHSRGSVMNLARDRYGCQKRTKKGVLAEMRALYLATYGVECRVGAYGAALTPTNQPKGTA